MGCKGCVVVFGRDSISYFYSEIVLFLSWYVTFQQIWPTKDYICTLLLHTLLYVSTWVVFEFETLALEFWCHLAAKLKKWKPDLHFRALELELCKEGELWTKRTFYFSQHSSVWAKVRGSEKIWSTILTDWL